MAFIIINKNGNALRSLPAASWNGEGRNVGKPVQFWTFSEKGCDKDKNIWSDTILKALKHLEEKGYSDVTVVPLTDENETKAEEVAASCAVEKGKVQPRTEEEAMKLLEEHAPEELIDPIHEEVYARCRVCNKNCKLSIRHTMYKCDAYEPLVVVA